MTKQRKIARSALDWFVRNARDLPWRRTHDPYGIWVSEIMLQQTRVSTVVPYWERWMQTLPDVRALADAKPGLLHKLWEGLGYYTRVRNLQRAAQFIVAKPGGRFPRKFEEVLALPGIGRYTAGAICSIAFDQPQPILDGNVMRVLTRLYGIGGNPRSQATNAKLWKLAGELVLEAAATRHRTGGRKHPNRRKGHFHRPCAQFNQSLMELGATICTPRQPQCGKCPLAAECVARQQRSAHRFPEFGRRRRATPRRFAAFVVRKQDRLLVRQRPAGAVNAHLWEFPNVELALGNADLDEAARLVLGIQPKKLEPLLTVRHSITRYRIQLEAYRALGLGMPKVPADKGKGLWISQSRLHRLAFTAAHKKILLRLSTR